MIKRILGIILAPLFDYIYSEEIEEEEEQEVTEQKSQNKETDILEKALEDIKKEKHQIRAADDIPLKDIQIDEEGLEYMKIWMSCISDYIEGMAKSRAKVCMRKSSNISDVALAFAGLMDPSSIMNISSVVGRKLSLCMIPGFKSLFDTEGLGFQDGYEDEEQ